MKRMIAGAIAGVLLLAAPASAQTPTVPSGRTTMIDFIALYSAHTCRSQQPPKVHARARHGIIQTEWTSKRTSALVPSDGGDKCSGSRLKGIAVYYTPRLGFTGTDWVQIEVDYRDGFGHRQRADRSLSLDVR